MVVLIDDILPRANGVAVILIENILEEYIKLLTSATLPREFFSSTRRTFFKITTNRPFGYNFTWGIDGKVDENLFIPADEVLWLMMPYSFSDTQPIGVLELEHGLVSDISDIQGR